LRLSGGRPLLSRGPAALFWSDPPSLLSSSPSVLLSQTFFSTFAQRENPSHSLCPIAVHSHPFFPPRAAIQFFFNLPPLSCCTLFVDEVLGCLSECLSLSAPSAPPFSSEHFRLPYGVLPSPCRGDYFCPAFLLGVFWLKRSVAAPLNN